MAAYIYTIVYKSGREEQKLIKQNRAQHSFEKLLNDANMARQISFWKKRKVGDGSAVRR